MNRLLYLFILSLLLLTATACSKKNEPQPRLEGTWLVTQTESTVYHADGSELSKSGRVLVSYPWTYAFTTSALTMVDGPATYHYSYQLSKQVLTLFPENGMLSVPFTQTVVELTQTNLTLQDQRNTQQGGRMVSFFYLVRQ